VEIVGVIDSDYVVDKNWLKDLVPQFVDKKIAIVQRRRITATATRVRSIDVLRRVQWFLLYRDDNAQ
jgi:cellulose synthase/poly-beta-1,6-N-acetylglucosamine synthase-like glycosyltransferase